MRGVFWWRARFSARAADAGTVYSCAVTELTDYFGPDSALQQYLPGFQPRAGQAWMAEAVAETIAGAGRLVVEAGTGTGKTFAYLIPALLSGRKTIISTGTKALQDQLYHRDLPLVGKAVGRPVTTALLKGRANYLCLHRLEQVTEPAMALQDDLHEVRPGSALREFLFELEGVAVLGLLEESVGIRVPEAE